MVPRRMKSNPKRRLSNGPDHVRLEAVREQVRYRGSPLHKRSPGDYGLTPPSDPRPNKTLCDGVSVFQREVAQELLEQGIGRGLVSADRENDFPRYVWAITQDGVVVEARCDDFERGQYHGYPLDAADPMSELVRRRWQEAEG